MSWRSAVRFPGLLGTLAFAAYLAWNIRWLAQGKVPPSILIGVFGVPAPTTGMTRSTLAMLRGDWGAAFLWNPFTVPFFAVLVWTAVEVGGKLVRRRRVVASRPLVLAWIVVLTGGWLAKFVMGPQWW